MFFQLTLPLLPNQEEKKKAPYNKRLWGAGSRSKIFSRMQNSRLSFLKNIKNFSLRNFLKVLKCQVIKITQRKSYNPVDAVFVFTIN